MPQALPAAKPGNAGSPKAEAGHQQDAESTMSDGGGQTTLNAPSLNMALPEEHPHPHPALQRQEATCSSSPTLHPNIAPRDAAVNHGGGVRATLTTTEPERLGDIAVVEHNHDQGKTCCVL